MENCGQVSFGSGLGQDAEYLDDDDEMPGEVVDWILLDCYSYYKLVNKRYVYAA